MRFDIQKVFFLFSLVALFGLSSCVDQEFNEPDVTGSPLTVEANTTIQDLKALYIPGKPTEIVEEVIIRGVVTANDRSGNFYRTFYMQDSTGGLEVQIALTNSYNFYLVGRELAIDCQGLVLGEYNGVVYLGGYIFEEDGADNVGLIVDYNQRIYRGELVGAPAPEVKTINQLDLYSQTDISRLIQLDDVEFALGELGLTYSDNEGRQTINRTVVDCNGNEIVLRTSGFSTFAGDTIAPGNGSLVGIYSVFRDTRQFYIRDLNDVMFDGERCDGGTGEFSLMTIQELRDAFAGVATSGPAEKKIRGVVISDNSSGNFDARNMVIQDATAGITVRFQDDHNFILNEEVEVIVSGQELSEFNGLLQVSNVSNGLASSIAVNQSVAPRVATVNEILENAEAWESTLIQIENASFNGGSTFADANSVSDGSGSIDIFTRNAANFANTAVPSEPVSLLAIVSQFNGYQILMRNIGDVDGEIGGGGDPVLTDMMDIRELFESGAGSAPADVKIRGVVISDKDNQNTHERNVIIQDNSGGLVVRFDGPHNFSYGEEIEVVVSGQELSEFNGLFQVNEVPLSNATSFGNGTLPAPREATIQEIVDNLEDWESTVVKITDVTFPDGGVFEFNQTLQDPTGNIIAFTRTQASFFGDNVPSGTVTLTVVVSEYTEDGSPVTPQVTIRNLNDIEQ
jgi:DNA/RNA endonuclease YhcR with UshA esterase domain